jgi:hypothetical protein
MRTLTKPSSRRRFWLLVALFALLGGAPAACYVDGYGYSGGYAYPAYAPANYGAYTYYGYYPAPSPGMTWIEGRWVATGGHYGWRSGYWTHAHPGYGWQRGHYYYGGRGGYHYQPGYWYRH